MKKKKQPLQQHPSFYDRYAAEARSETFMAHDRVKRCPLREAELLIALNDPRGHEFKSIVNRLPIASLERMG